MDQIIRIGMDTSKHVFQLHGVNAAEEPVLRKKLRRKEMVVFFQRLAPTVIAIEACGGSHHWARLLGTFGHQVKLIAPQLVKPYVKRGKNDAAGVVLLLPVVRYVTVQLREQIKTSQEADLITEPPAPAALARAAWAHASCGAGRHGSLAPVSARMSQQARPVQ